MKIGRYLRRKVPIIHAVDAVKNMVEEGSVKEGAKRTAKEDYCEDFIPTKLIYDAGKTDGKVEGYAEASDEYEKKLLRQADEFIKQKKLYAEQLGTCAELINECETEIENLVNKKNKTQEENTYLQQLLLKERELKKLKNG